jgi:tetratricopeptide (TPR) repeat protein
MVERSFPPPAFDLYAKTSDPILSLVLDEPSAFQLASGRRLDALGRVRRLLALHRRALEAEGEGVTRRADFYWGEVFRAVRALWGDRATWEAAAARGGGNMSGRELRDLLLIELFADTHRALFMTYYSEEAASDSRAFVHGGYLRRLIESTDLPRHRAYAILRPLAEREIAALRKGRQWRAARTLAVWMMELNPDAEPFHDLAAQIELEFVSSELTGATTEASAAREAGILQKAIDMVAGYLPRHPTPVSFFDVLGTLYRAQAVRLANSRSVARALSAVEAALAYGGDDKDAQTVKQQLQQLMHDKKEAVEKLVMQVRRTPNARLSAAGLAEKSDANVGTSFADRFRASDRPGIEAMRRRAMDCVLFRRIGIPAPAEHAAETAGDVRHAIDFISSHGPASFDDVENWWSEAAARSPHLGSVDRDGVLRFLALALYGDPDEEVLEQFAGTMKAASRKPGQEPFPLWLYSGRNAFTKLLAAAAAVVLIIAGVGGLRAGYLTYARNTAFEAVRASAAADDDAATIRAAKAFFDSAAPPREDETKAADVKALYGRAVTRRFLASAQNGGADARSELGQYQTYLASMAQQGGGK